MDIRLLRTFVAAFEEANFTRAAQRLHATQPGVSVQIAALEAHVGTTLFDRNARSVTATVAARRLYPRALKLIHDFNSAVQDIRALSGVITGRVAVGIPATLSSELVPPVLAQYLAAYPHNEIRIVEGPSEALLSQIERGELDLALLTHPVDQPAISAHRICRDRILLASGPLNGFEPGVPVHLDAVQGSLKIVLPSMLRHALSGELAEPLRPGRIVPERLIELDGLECALKLVVETDWVALLPASAVSDEARRSHVRFSAIAGEEFAVDYFVAHAGTEPPSTAARAFIDMVATELSRISRQCDADASTRPRRDRAPQTAGRKGTAIDWTSPAVAQGLA
jgi:LysR family transcriptional regulator, nitrogen assimilation regulatory protein